MKMSETRELQNRRALARLQKTLPADFPAPALIHALARRWTPPMPRLAVDSYWRAHPLRADRLARALAARSGTPKGWTWRIKSPADGDLPASFRAPPAPYREKAFSRGPGFCCVCGQPVYRLGWHEDLWDRGPNQNAVWHTACVTAWPTCASTMAAWVALRCHRAPRLGPTKRTSCVRMSRVRSMTLGCVAIVSVSVRVTVVLRNS